MQIGAILLTAQDGSTQRNQLIMYIIAQFIFGCALACRRLTAPVALLRRVITKG